MNKREEDFLKDAFDKAVYDYNEACKKNGGHEGSVACYRHLVEMETLQNILFKLCGLSYEIKRHF